MENFQFFFFFSRPYIKKIGFDHLVEREIALLCPPVQHEAMQNKNRNCARICFVAEVYVSIKRVYHKLSKSDIYAM